jgi:hypothetical protein
MNEPSRLYMLIEKRLGGDGTLAEFVAKRRASSSWMAMAKELSEWCDYEISDETLRRWFADRIQVQVTVAPTPGQTDVEGPSARTPTDPASTETAGAASPVSSGAPFSTSHPATVGSPEEGVTAA